MEVKTLQNKLREIEKLGFVVSLRKGNTVEPMRSIFSTVLSTKLYYYEIR